MIMDITGVTANEIIEIPLQIAQKEIAVNKKLSEFANDIIHKLI